MFQFCCSLVTAAFRGRSILNENSALLKWKWETFYLEYIKINRLIFFIIKMSKWMLLLFGIFPRFFHFWLKLLTQVQKKMVLMSTICALLFARTKAVHDRAWGPEEPRASCWSHPSQWELPTSWNLCTRSHRNLRLGEKKTVSGGNTTQLLLNPLSLFKAISKWKEGK